MAQVIHSLATSPEDDLPSHESWPTIARLLVAQGDDWPAARDLASMITISQPAITNAVTCLARQTGRDLGDAPRLGFWDTICGLVARSWHLGLFNDVDAMYKMNSLWWLVRDLDKSGSRSLQLIWQGMGLKELADHWDIGAEAKALLIEANRLIPASVTNGPLCTTVLEALY